MIDEHKLPLKPRVRVKARREGAIRVGGLAAHVEGYFSSLGHKLQVLVGKKGRVHKLEYTGWCGDYDRYRVIYD